MGQFHAQRESSVARAAGGPDEAVYRTHVRRGAHRELRRFLRIEWLLTRSIAFPRRHELD
jgi:hypothetical protein